MNKYTICMKDHNKEIYADDGYMEDGILFFSITRDDYKTIVAIFKEWVYFIREVKEIPLTKKK